jgi:medium-chain acyl-[acyl-carrier-protein] hydrolase
MRALSDWYCLLKPRPGRPRLFCFPFAGGGAATFRGWDEGLGGVVEVIAARPPGRESRMSEPALEDVAKLAAEATEALLSLIAREPARPFSLFGHSLGALVAFETGRALEQRGGPRPAAVFASGHSAPSWLDEEDKDAGRWPRDQLIAHLRKYDGTPAAILDNEELMDLVLPMLRADFNAAGDYRRLPGPPLGAQLFVYAGREDRAGTPEALSGWAQESSRCAERIFEGGHFFIESAKPQVWKTLAADLRAVFGT